MTKEHGQGTPLNSCRGLGLRCPARPGVDGAHFEAVRKESVVIRRHLDRAAVTDRLSIVVAVGRSRKVTLIDEQGRAVRPETPGGIPAVDHRRTRNGHDGRLVVDGAQDSAQAGGSVHKVACALIETRVIDREVIAERCHYAGTRGSVEGFSKNGMSGLENVTSVMVSSQVSTKLGRLCAVEMKRLAPPSAAVFSTKSTLVKVATSTLKSATAPPLLLPGSPPVRVTPINSKS